LRPTEKQHGISPKFVMGVVMIQSTNKAVINWLGGQWMPTNSLGTGQSGMTSWITCKAAAGALKSSAIGNHASNY